MGCCCSKSKKRSKKRQSETSEDNQSMDAPKGDSKNLVATMFGDAEKETAAGDKEERIIAYTALWDYKASNLAELSFFEGNTFVQIGDKCDAGPNWLFVMRSDEYGWSDLFDWCKPDSDERLRRMGILGYIPRNYVVPIGSVESEPPFVGHLTRKEAEKLLSGRPNGTFLIYYSGLRQVTLSVSYKRRVKHYPINTCVDEEGRRQFFVDSGRKYYSLRQMIDFFRDTKASYMCCRLTKSLPKPPPPPKCDLPAEIQERWREIPREQLHKDEKIGEFCTSVTFKGTWQSQSSQVNLHVAIKELKNWPSEDCMSTDPLTEAIVLKNLRHENIVRLVGIVTDQLPLVIVTEYVQNGSLYDYLRNPNRRSIPHWEVIDICRQIANGMYYLERMKVIHMGLHIRNVLIHEDVQSGRAVYHVRLADFGFTIAFKGQIEQEDSAFSYDPLRSEERMEYYTSDIDVLDFGLLLYVIYTSAMDPCISYEDRIKRISELKEKIVIPPVMPAKINSLMHTCLAEERQRPNFGKILDYLTKCCEELGAS